MKLYGSIEKAVKQDDGTIIVSGYASSETVDVDGEIIKADAIRDAIPDFMKFANVREMHQPKAIGTVLKMEVQDDGRTYVETHIVESEAVRKVEHKVLKGFSVGGKVTSRDEKNSKIIKGMRLAELSLVDRPANPDAVITICKVDDATGTDDGNATKVDKAVAATDLKKYVGEEVWDAQTALSALTSLIWLCEKESNEDDKGQASDIATACAKLKSFIASEIMESDEEDEDDDEVVEMAARATTLIKAAWSPEDAAKFEKLVTKKKDVIRKAGKRNSKADQEHLDQIHKHASAIADHAKKMGAAGDYGADNKAAQPDDLKKVASAMLEIGKAVGAGKEDDIVAKVTALVAEKDQAVEVSETLAKRLKALEELPAPSKVVLKVVEKTGDVIPADQKAAGDDAAKSDDTKGKPVDSKEELKKMWNDPSKRVMV